ncbi:hypothetical protein [Streptomyces sp. YPW6]|uniref:hypothetical protein n=1 Tax=Streptomyces sp. YPW6 TaxID=2840373 RepID=UPI003D742489
MSAALLALVVALALTLGAALAYTRRLDDRLDRELRALGGRPCPHHCTACSTAARRANKGDDTA